MTHCTECGYPIATYITNDPHMSFEVEDEACSNQGCFYSDPLEYMIQNFHDQMDREYDLTSIA
jgi:hypothetical protein